MVCGGVALGAGAVERSDDGVAHLSFTHQRTLIQMNNARYTHTDESSRRLLL